MNLYVCFVQIARGFYYRINYHMFLKLCVIFFMYLQWTTAASSLKNCVIVEVETEKAMLKEIHTLSTQNCVACKMLKALKIIFKRH